MGLGGLSRAAVRAVCWGVVGAFCWALLSPNSGFAQESAAGAPKHLGVQTCASSTCHGAVQPWQNSSVLQNEYVTWSQHDAHSKAYKTLLSDKSKLIAANLGIGAAHQSSVCLQCHSDFVPESQRAKFFKIEDGVGCEACHGGAENWLGLHVAGTGSHGDNLRNGMYPSDEPAARSKLCLGCHTGMGDRKMTHQILGAGHPRLVFELDTFVVNQPAHFRVDDDYKVRKTYGSAALNWAVGQVDAADMMLAAMGDPKRSGVGIFPEFAFFDCHACHHPMKAVDRNTGSHATGPGVPRLNDANLIMVSVLASVIDPGQAKVIAEATRDMHRASVDGVQAVRDAVGNLRKAVASLRSRVAATRFTPAMTADLFAKLAEAGAAGRYVDYLEAEQATMAAATFLSVLERSSEMSGERLSKAKRGLEKLYAATENENTYKAASFTSAMALLKGATN